MENFEKNIDLISKLKSNNINVEDSFSNELALMSYSSFITPYKDLICCGTNHKQERIYPNDCSTNDFKEFVKCDIALASILRTYISFFENYLKAFLIETLGTALLKEEPFFSEEQKDNYINEKKAFGCFIPINKKYDTQGMLNDIEENTETNSMYKQRIRALDSLILSKNNKDNYKANSYCKYFFEKNVQPPLWSSVHNMSLRELCALFNMLEMKHRKEFFSRYVLYSPNDRHSYDLSYRLFTICDIRNVVQHYEPVIPFLYNFSDKRFQQLVQTIEDLKTFCKNNPFYQNNNQTVKFAFKQNEYNKNKVNKINQIISVI